MFKNGLEREKLKLEIERLKRPFYKDLDFWKVLIPSLAVIASIIITFYTGWIDSEKSRLALEKEQLRAEVRKFEETRREIKDSIKFASIELDTILTRIDLLKHEKDSLLNSLINFKGLVKKAKNEKNILEEDLSFFKSELIKKFASIKSMDQKINSLQSDKEYLKKQVEIDNVEIRFLKGKVNLSKMDSLELIRLKSQASIEFDGVRILELEKKSKEIEERFNKRKEEIDKMSAKELGRWFDMWFLEQKGVK